MADETITRLCPTCLHDGTLELALARADAAEARLAEIHRTVVDGFLAEYGTSTLATFKVALDLAWSVRKILAGSGIAAREAIEEAEREKLLTHVHEDWTPCPACPLSGSGRPCACSGVPCCEMERREIAARAEGQQEAAEAELAGAAAAERERISAALAARKVTLTRPGFGIRQASNTDMVPWEAVAEVLGGTGAADGEALARVKHLGKVWAGLPADTAASLTLRDAGAQLLARIEGSGASGVTRG